MLAAVAGRCNNFPLLGHSGLWLSRKGEPEAGDFLAATKPWHAKALRALCPEAGGIVAQELSLNVFSRAALALARCRRQS